MKIGDFPLTIQENALVALGRASEGSTGGLETLIGVLKEDNPDSMRYAAIIGVEKLESKHAVLSRSWSSENGPALYS